MVYSKDEHGGGGSPCELLRWVRAVAFERLIRDKRFASEVVTVSVGALGLARPNAVVVADAHHQTVAARDLAGGLVEQDPDLEADVMFGALALARLEARGTDHLLGAWQAGRSSLRRPLDEPVDPPGRVEDRAPADDPRG